ncbi:MAG TPA: ABC transporter ATP-binding protein [Xanthomonadales bacterium]|nr:ABC transporter ATP-binding protein [Xanthomonadales bacterium]
MIRLDALQKRYGRTTALDGLTLAVARGEVFGLLGPNGAGKSTTMGVITGLVAPDAGTVAVCGGSPGDPAVRARIGLAPQSLALYPLLTGRENVEFFGRVFGLAQPALRQRVDAVLEFVQLADRQHDRVGGYSGGMQRRLNLAVALVHDPELVLMDEPTAGVDPQSRHAIFELVKALRAQGRTVVYTTHYMEEAAQLCDRIAVVDHGRVLAQGTLDELVRAHGGEATLVVRRGAQELREAAREALSRLNAIAADGAIDEFRLERPTLEQVFLNLTGRTLRDDA